MSKMKTKMITFKLEGYEIERMRRTINALKDFNRATDEKADISYEVIQNLDCADQFLGRLIGMEQSSDDGRRNWWAEYEWKEEDAD